MTFAQAIRGLAATGALMLAGPAAAGAKIVPVIPPGNSGANQYVEAIPTAGGGRPSSTVTAGGGSANAPSGGSSAVAPSTGSALAQQGQLGVLATAITRATAPTGIKGVASPSVSVRHHTTTSAKGSSTGGSTTGPGPRRSAASEVFAALSGSATHGGLGPLLPVILVATLVGLAAFAIRRTRGRET